MSEILSCIVSTFFGALLVAAALFTIFLFLNAVLSIIYEHYEQKEIDELVNKYVEKHDDDH